MHKLWELDLKEFNGFTTMKLTFMGKTNVDNVDV